MNSAPVGQKRVLILILLGVVAAGLIFILVDISRNIAADEQVVIALQSTNQAGVVIADGIQILRRVDRRAIPILLQWSEGRVPRWYKLPG